MPMASAPFLPPSNKSRSMLATGTIGGRNNCAAGSQHVPAAFPISVYTMNSFDPGPVSGNPTEGGPVLVMPPPRRKPTKWELWRSRLFLLEFMFVCFVTGIILIVAPWTSFWTDNSLLSGFPQLRQFLMYDFVRGLISGLGLTDVWLAVSEVIRYREEPD